MPRAVVAGDAEHRDAEELLGGMRGEVVVGVLRRSVVLQLPHDIVRRPRHEGIALAGEELAHHDVVRLAGADRVADPSVVHVAADVELARVRRDLHVLHEIAEPHRPAVDERVGGEQRVDLVRALRRRWIGDERGDLRGRRDLSGEIERDAAEELLVAGERGRHDVIRGLLRGDPRVDVVRDRQRGVRRMRDGAVFSRRRGRDLLRVDGELVDQRGGRGVRAAEHGTRAIGCGDRRRGGSRHGDGGEKRENSHDALWTAQHIAAFTSVSADAAQRGRIGKTPRNAMQ